MINNMRMMAMLKADGFQPQSKRFFCKGWQTHPLNLKKSPDHAGLLDQWPVFFMATWVTSQYQVDAETEVQG